ncbi:uxuA [Symbiodinium pilosum]|uniref:UxuA protein n=1 Tax=Symbiodinium pilosum TaxID=2952 RepID=A0A812TRL8_SYMPI|nr:uxuA [Symbiodinium pilosum]
MRSDLAEYGRIGRYYAEQSMLVTYSQQDFGTSASHVDEKAIAVLDPATGKYSEELRRRFPEIAFVGVVEVIIVLIQSPPSSSELTPSYGRTYFDLLTDLRAFLTEALEEHRADDHRKCGANPTFMLDEGGAGQASISEQIQEAFEKLPNEDQQKIKSCLSPEDQAKVEALKCLARENLLRAAANGELERALKEIKEKHSTHVPPPPPA